MRPNIRFIQDWVPCFALIRSREGMDDAQQIVVAALEQAGVVLPPGVAGVHDVGPAALISMCSQVLALVAGGGQDVYMPGSVPQSAAERFRVCTRLAEAVKQLGYRDNLSFHQFLYPNEADVHRLLRFLLEKLSKASPILRGRTTRRRRGVHLKNELGDSDISVVVKRALSGWTEATDAESSSPFRTCQLRLASDNEVGSAKKAPPLVTLQAKPKEWLIPSVLELNSRSAVKKEHSSAAPQVEGGYKVITHGNFFLDSETTVSVASRDDEVAAELKEEQGSLVSVDKGELDLKQQKEIVELEEKLILLTEQIAKIDQDSKETHRRFSEAEKQLVKESEKTRLLEDEFTILQEAIDIIKRDSTSPESAIEQLDLSLNESRQMLYSTKEEWESARKHLEKQRNDLEVSLETRKSERQWKLRNNEQLEQEIVEITAKIHARQEEQALLTSELERCPKQASRSSYVRRITELVKNSKKQDADVAKIILETRALQRDGNATQDRLHRIHALVDELVFRDAKKDATCRLAYRLLSSMHENFADIVEKVFEMDKLDREIADLHAKLEVMEKEPVDLDRVQADLDAIVAENLLLEKKKSGIVASNPLALKAACCVFSYNSGDYLVIPQKSRDF